MRFIVALLLAALSQPSSAQAKPDDQLSCAEIKAEGMRMQALAMRQNEALSEEAVRANVSAAPAEAAAATAAGIVAMQTAAGMLGGNVAAQVAGAAGHAAIVGSSKAAGAAMSADLNAYAGGVKATSDQAITRMSQMHALYQTHCLTDADRAKGEADAAAAQALAAPVEAAATESLAKAKSRGSVRRPR